MGHLSKGGRYWLFPTNYESLRMKYLHFSASDFVLPVNAPGYDEDDVMCRITYHGDNVEQRSAAEGVHFLYELSGTAMSIGFEGNPPSRSRSPYSVEHSRQCSTDKKTTRKIGSADL